MDIIAVLSLILECQILARNLELEFCFNCCSLNALAFLYLSHSPPFDKTNSYVIIYLSSHTNVNESGHLMMLRGLTFLLTVFNFLLSAGASYVYCYLVLCWICLRGHCGNETVGRTIAQPLSLLNYN